MVALRVAGWSAFGFSGIALVLLINDGFTPYLGAALSLILGGVLLLAADRALQLLADIRDALVKSGTSPVEDNAETKILAEPRSAAEITQDIDRLKNRQ